MFTATDFNFVIQTSGVFVSAMNWTSILIDFLYIVEILVSLMMIFLVLMQRPKSEGLGAAFGGGMTEGLFGAQTTNVLQKGTRWLAGMFFLVALILSMLYSKSTHNTKGSVIQQQLANAPAPKEQKADETPLVPVTGGTSAAPTSGTGAASSTSGTSASSATNATTGETPSSSDLSAPKLQLGPNIPTGTGAASDELPPPNLQLQTGSTAPGATDIFKTGGSTSGTGQK
jgi:preprotein translocase subunit SecG